MKVYLKCLNDINLIKKKKIKVIYVRILLLINIFYHIIDNYIMTFYIMLFCSMLFF